MDFKDATIKEVAAAMELADKAFVLYREKDLKSRAAFLYSVAAEMEKVSDDLLTVASKETNLTKARLQVELKRTLFQLTSYGDACADGTWMDIRIDTADPDRNPPKPDLRKMLIPLGPVVVFGASNFPFAYSTAGGDTACALAAGCPVVLKAHPAHAQTSTMVATAIQSAAMIHNLPDGVFIHFPRHWFRL